MKNACAYFVNPNLYTQLQVQDLDLLVWSRLSYDHNYDHHDLSCVCVNDKGIGSGVAKGGPSRA